MGASNSKRISVFRNNNAQTTTKQRPNIDQTTSTQRPNNVHTTSLQRHGHPCISQNEDGWLGDAACDLLREMCSSRRTWRVGHPQEGDWSIFCWGQAPDSVVQAASGVMEAPQSVDQTGGSAAQVPEDAAQPPSSAAQARQSAAEALHTCTITCCTGNITSCTALHLRHHILLQRHCVTLFCCTGSIFRGRGVVAFNWLAWAALYRGNHLQRRLNIASGAFCVLLHWQHALPRGPFSCTRTVSRCTAHRHYILVDRHELPWKFP